MRKNAVCFGAPLFFVLTDRTRSCGRLFNKEHNFVFFRPGFFAPGVSFFAVLTVSLTVYIFPCAA